MIMNFFSRCPFVNTSCLRNTLFGAQVVAGGAATQVIGEIQKTTLQSKPQAKSFFVMKMF